MQERRRVSLVGPAILIGFGLLLLANNFGLLPGNVWAVALRFWPVILILLGLEILIGRRSTLASAIIAIIGLLLIVGLVVAAIYWNWGGVAQSGISEHLVQEMEGAESAVVSLDFAVGDLRVRGLKDSPDLMDARFNGLPVEHQYEVTAGRGHLQLKSSGGDIAWWPNAAVENTWDIALSSRIPLILDVETGVGQAVLDFSDLQVTDFSLNAGVGGVRVILPAKGRVMATVEAGMGGVVLEIPPGMAARIDAEVGLGGLKVDESRFPRTGKYYESPDYATADNRVDLRIDGGIGAITVR
ncbi:MAG: DUF5668 domain-containing protein [Anaerolineae bacterium]|nr:DUF5668 domain-containing protein [Anaerolineae bacterium]MDH7474319.1 DUF5668 domain-containing protein [Anaerolineae bacterium]